MKKLILDSALASNKNSSQPLWRFSAGVPVHGIRLNTVVLPLSYYNVTADNNVVQFSDGNQLRTATLTPGSYSATEVTDELARALSAGGTQTYSTSFDPVRGKITVTASAPFKFVKDGSTASKVLGLNGNTDPATSLTFQQTADLTGTQLILLNSPEISARGNIVYAGRESLNIIDAIPITQDLGTVLVHQNHMSDYLDVSDQVLSEVSLTLLDSATLKPLDLNGESFQIILDVE